MAEMERFERRLAASLERLADEVPTHVDARQLAAEAAAANARPRWLTLLLGERGRQLNPALWTAVVVAATLLLLLGVLIVGQRMSRAPFEATTHGPMSCVGPALGSTSGDVVLDCTSRLANPRLAGPVRISLGGATPHAGATLRRGAMTVDGVDARWSGDVIVMSAPNGVITGEASLMGDRAGAGIVLRVRLLSGDGRDWGLLGWAEEVR